MNIYMSAADTNDGAIAVDEYDTAVPYRHTATLKMRADVQMLD
jgi:hypothetical protein